MSIIYYVILSSIVLLIIGNLFTVVLQDLFIFRPVKLEKEYRYNFKLPFEEFTVATKYHGKINVLWFRNPDKKRPLVFYNHGNSSNLSTWGEESEYFDKLGYDMIIYDFRGFGKSKGIRNELTFRSDAREVFTFARQHYADEDIVIYGRSMGTGVATMLATEFEAKLLILEAPYHSIRELFRSYYPFLPVYLFSFKYNFPTNEWIQKVKCPVFIFQGTRDKVIPYRCAVKLKPLMKKPENFITISGAGHNDLAQYGDYSENLKHLLRHAHS